MNKLKWTNGNKTGGKGGRKWVHTPDNLMTGHVAYLVKFYGKTEANQPKGIEVVKESIQKLKFNNQLKMSEGSKIPKVEITISVDGVAIQDPKTKHISYQYPLHQISYCADDKSDKKLFCFIAKEPNSDKHSSFVFASDKNAEEITLTIGQAFDLAYRRFLDSSGKELEMRRRIMVLHKKVQDLEAENKRLYEQLVSLQKNKDTNDLKSKKNGNNNLSQKGNTQGKNDVCPPPIQPPPSFQRHSGRSSIQQDLLDFVEEPKTKEKYEEFFDDIRELENTYNGNSAYSTSNNRPLDNKYDPLSAANVENDPFGMGNFGSAHFQDQDFKNVIGEVDKRLLEMRDGFKRGISFGNDDFASEYWEITSK